MGQLGHMGQVGQLGHIYHGHQHPKLSTRNGSLEH